VITAKAISAFLTYFVTGVFMAWVFTLIYVAITPGNELHKIRAGRIAPAITLVAALFGFALPLLSASLHGIHFMEFILWAVIAGGAQIAAFYAFSKLMPGLWNEIVNEDNLAAAILCGGLSIVTGLFNAFSLIP
jgi:putative membrane protein